MARAPKKAKEVATAPPPVRHPEITVHLRRHDQEEPFHMLMRARAVMKTGNAVPIEERTLFVREAPLQATRDTMLAYLQTWVTVQADPPGAPVAATRPGGQPGATVPIPASN